MKIENIINFDVQGWPLCKLTLRDLLYELGARTCDFPGMGHMFGFEPNDPILDAFPITYVDDGMGYGVEAMPIICASAGDSKNGKYITIFREKELPKEKLESKLSELNIKRDCITSDNPESLNLPNIKNGD